MGPKDYNLRMILYVNGKENKVSPEATVEQLVLNMGLSGKRIAVEVNQQIISRSLYEKYTLKENDRVEIVQAIGGG